MLQNHSFRFNFTKSSEKNKNELLLLNSQFIATDCKKFFDKLQFSNLQIQSKFCRFYCKTTDIYYYHYLMEYSLVLFLE